MSKRRQKPSPRIRAILACKIARVDPCRFNEAVAAGNYRCAPATTKGSARLFGVDDVVALFIYGQMRLAGLEARTAGLLAAVARSSLKEFPRSSAVSCDIGIGFRITFEVAEIRKVIRSRFGKGAVSPTVSARQK